MDSTSSVVAEELEFEEEDGGAEELELEEEDGGAEELEFEEEDGCGGGGFKSCTIFMPGAACTSGAIRGKKRAYALSEADHNDMHHIHRNPVESNDRMHIYTLTIGQLRQMISSAWLARRHFQSNHMFRSGHVSTSHKTHTGGRRATTLQLGTFGMFGKQKPC